MYDLQIYNEFLVLATQEGVIEIYKDYVLVNKISNLSLLTVYNQSPGHQSNQFGRMLHKLDSGFIFFVIARDKYEIAYIDLNSERLERGRIPNLRSETITAFYVHECSHGYSELMSPTSLSHHLL